MARRETNEAVERLFAFTRVVRLTVRETYAALGVGSAQAKLLRHIGKNSRISQADLARATATAPTLTGRGLATLIERGWVKRTRSQEDRREYILELTASGQRARKKVDEARGRIVDRIGSRLDSRDAKDLQRIVDKVLAAFEAPEI